VFKNLGKDILRYLGVSPQLSAEEIQEKAAQEEVIVPDIVNTSYEDAQRILRVAGLETRVEGEGSWVVKQQPQGGTKFPVGSKVIIYLGKQGKGVPNGELVTMPDLTGLTMREAGQLLGKLGLQFDPQGTGVAVEQKILAGTKVKAGSSVTVIFAPPVSEPSP